MKTNNQTGRNIVLLIGIYLIVKSIVNLCLGGGFLDVLLAVLEAVVLFTGLQYVNYAVALILAVTALYYMPGNISNFSSNWLYFIEGVIDIIFAVLMIAGKNIRLHFTNKWSEISNLIKK